MLAALLSACGTIYITPTPTDTPTPVLPTATVTPTVTLTETPRPTWTPVPTLTSTVTSTATALPTSTSVPDWCRASQRTPTPPIPLAAPLETLRVAFIFDGDAWVWDDGGEPEQVLTSGDIVSVDLSEDGRTLAFVRSGLGAEIWALDLESGIETLLVSPTDLLAQAGQPDALAAVPHHLSWVPGRRALAYNARPVWAEPRDFIPDDLWTVEVPSGEVHNILPHGQGGEFVYSPNGRQIAILDLDSLDLVDSAGGSRRPNLVPNYHGVGLGTDNYYPRPFWAADSRSLLVAVPTPLDAQKPNPEVTFYRLAPLFVRAKPVETVVAFPPSVIFSPDQSLAAYLRWPDLTPQIKELHVAIATGLESDDLLHSTGHNLEFLAWRPGSLDFAYWLPRSRRLMVGQLCAAPEPLVEEVFDLGAFRWVDSQRFLFASGSPEEAELYLGEVEGETRFIGNLGDPVVFDVAVVN